MGFLDATGVTKLVTELRSRFAAIAHAHSANDITSGTLPVARGGTSASDAAGARASLGTPASSSIASVEQSTATANHAVGSHFVLANELKKATSAIASGENITSNNSTNSTVQEMVSEAVQSAISSYGMMRTTVYSLTSIATNSAGYADLISALGTAYPNVDFTDYVMITLESWTAMSPTACAFTTAGRYLLANPSTTITGLKVRVWKRPS